MNQEEKIEKSQSQEESSSESSAQLCADVTNLDIGKQMVMKSLCTHCGKQGITKMIFVKIPKFQEMSISSFKCKNCGFTGRDVSQLAEYQSLGTEITLQVKCAKDLSRGLVKSSFCAVNILENQFQIEARPMSGVYTTVEGLIKQAADNLSIMQPQRHIYDKASADKIDECIMQLLNFVQKAQQIENPKDTICTIVLSDPSGNSFIEPLPELNHLSDKQFHRTLEQAEMLGISKEQEEVIQRETKTVKVDDRIVDEIQITNVVSEIPSKCPACLKEIMHKSVIINIPYFKKCLLMCAKCDDCGYKSIEVNSAEEIPKLGRKTVFKVTDPSDLSREVLKSTSCTVNLPELGVELSAGTLGGIYTTLEGLIVQIKEELTKHSQFWLGDSSRSIEIANNWKKVLQTLSDYAEGKKNFTIEIDDPLDASFIKNIYAPDVDPEMTITSYQRTQEQNEEYGLDLCDKGDE